MIPCEIEFIIHGKSLKSVTLEPAFEYRDAELCISVYGDFMGIIDASGIYMPYDAFDILKNQITKTHKVMRSVVGACYVVVETEYDIRIYASCTSPGLFFTRDDEYTILSNSEKNIYVNYGKPEAIDKGQVISHLLSHQILLRTVPNTLFHNISRCPPGSCYRARGDCSGDWTLYIQKSNEELESAASDWPFRKQLAEYSRLLEGILTLYKAYHQSNKLVLLKSGGIDSAALLAAASKVALPLDQVTYIPYGLKSIPQQTQAGLIAAHFGKQITYQSIKSINTDYLKNLGKSGLGVIPGSHYFDYMERDYAASEDRQVVEISGQNMDTLYSLDNYSPSSYSYGLIKWSRGLRSVWKRLLLTDFVMDKGSVARNVFLRNFRPNMDYSNYNYIRSMTVALDEHVLPFTRQDEIKSDIAPDKIIEKYCETRETALHDVLDRVSAGSCQSVDALDVRSFNHLIRLVRWCRTPQNVPINYFNATQRNNIIKLIPYTEGPLVDFFLNYQLTIPDAFFVKRLVNGYFKKISGKNLEYFAMSTRSRSQRINVMIYNLLNLIVPTKILDGALRKMRPRKQHSKQAVAQDAKMQTPIFAEINQKILFNEMYILQFVDSPEDKAMIKDLYMQIQGGETSRPISRKEDMVICRLVNLDIFLRSVFNEQPRV